ncbi:MAG: VOC family protein [Patescibacteria group bacterium]
MKLHHVAITVKDLPTSVSFYDGIGFKEINRFRRDDMCATALWLQGENLIIELWQFDSLNEGTREDLSFTGLKHIAFTDSDPELLRKIFIDKGVSCSPLNKGSSGGLYFFLSDPDGNQIEIYKPPKI